jgi:hypothetical protein
MGHVDTFARHAQRARVKLHPHLPSTARNTERNGNLSSPSISARCPVLTSMLVTSLGSNEPSSRIGPGPARGFFSFGVLIAACSSRPRAEREARKPAVLPVVTIVVCRFTLISSRSAIHVAPVFSDECKEIRPEKTKIQENCRPRRGTSRVNFAATRAPLQLPFNSAPLRNLRIVALRVAREPHRAGGFAPAPLAHEGPLAEQRWVMSTTKIDRHFASGGFG